MFQPTATSKLFGWDCEMVGTKVGNEVCSVSLVDESGATLMDQMVKPDGKITDYRTNITGFKKEVS